MNRRAWKLTRWDAVLFALLGLVSTLTIASGVVWSVPRYVDIEPIVSNGGYRGPILYRQIGFEGRVQRPDDHYNQPAVERLKSGLPFFSLQRHLVVDVHLLSERGIFIFDSHFSLRKNLHLYRPAWPGLLADTLFYAAILYLIRAAFRTLKSRRRIRRGHCPSCNYDRTGIEPSTPCPECGPANLASSK